MDLHVIFFIKIRTHFQQERIREKRVFRQILRAIITVSGKLKQVPIIFVCLAPRVQSSKLYIVVLTV